MTISFVKVSASIDEPGSDTDHRIVTGITQSPGAGSTVTLQISKAGSPVSTADTTGDNIDVTFYPTTVTFTPTDYADKNIILGIH